MDAHPQIDAILLPHRPALGGDYEGYRNHAQRVFRFAAALLEGATVEKFEQLSVAAAFHDLGIWVAGTFDYLPPSRELARAWLTSESKQKWAPVVEECIELHHCLTRVADDPRSMVEAFRRADLVDVSWGRVSFGLPGALVKATQAAFPNRGFHSCLVRLFARRMSTHPLTRRRWSSGARGPGNEPLRTQRPAGVAGLCVRDVYA